MSLVRAARDGDLDRVKSAVSGGAYIDGRDSYGDTALLKACWTGHVDIVKYLLDNGANTELKGKDKLTPLQVACIQGHVAVVQAFHDHGVDFNGTERDIKFGRSPLHLACEFGRVEVVKALFENGVKYNQTLTEDTIKDGKTPLQLSCREGKVAIVHTLLDYGVDLNQPFNEADIYNCQTPLQLACRTGEVAIVQTLLDRGADLNQTFNESTISRGVTPLQLAYRYGQDEVIETLFDHGMDTGYLMTVLKKGIRDRDVGITDQLRKKMGINQEAIGDTLFNEAYQEALKDGATSNDRIPVMIIGQDRSGKTSLRKRLLGLPFDPNESSTVGIHVDLVKVTSETSKEPWQPTTDERILTSKKVATEKVSEKAGIVLKHKTMDKQFQMAPLSSTNLTDSFDTIQQSKQRRTPMDKTQSVTARTCLQEGESMQQVYSGTILNQRCSVESNATTRIQASDEQDQPIGNLTSTAMAVNQQDMLISGGTAEPQLMDEIPSSGPSLNEEYTMASNISVSERQQSKPIKKTLPPTDEQEFPKATRKMNVKEKNAKKPSATEKARMMHYRDVHEGQEGDTVRILVHDLAGQAIYYDTHYLFLKSQAPYILVHDLTKDLDETAEPRFKPRFKVELNLGNPLLQNNLDYLLCWLSVLGQLGETEKQKSEEFSDFVLPPVVIVLTNEDQFEGDVEAVKRRIRDVTVSYQNVFRNFYVIDNTKTSGNNDPVTELREKIFSLCKEILAKEPPMPMKWLKFEGALSEQTFSGRECNYISIDKAKKIAKKCNIHSFVDALKFLHRQGVVVYYEECPYVVLNPPWLMNLFTEIITVPEDSENIKPMDATYYQKLREKGVLMQKFLTKHPHGDLLENVMQKVSLMCPLKHEGKSAFLVPSVAPFMEEGENIMPKLKLSPIASIFIRFLVGFIPLGVFTRFQVKLVKMCKGILRIDEPQLFCNYTLLPVKHSSINFDVYLIQLIEKIKIGVCPKDKVTNNKSLGKFVCLLRNLLQQCLEEIKTDEPLFYRGLAYEFCVRCTACAEVIKKPCLRHDDIRCQHDECAHMHPLIDIQNCSSSSLCCDADKTKSLEFGFERVNPWVDTVSKDESSSKTGFVRRTIFKAVRKTPFNIHRSQSENEPDKSIGSRRDVEEKKPSHELSGKKKKRACESETMLQDDEINNFSDGHESQPTVTDNEENLLGNVSSCFNSLDIKHDFRVEILQGQDKRQSRKRQTNTTDKENKSSTSGEYVTDGSSSVDTCWAHVESSSRGTSHEVFSASQWKQRKINDLNAEDYDKICDELNIKNSGRDYKTLAGRMRYSVNEVKKFERHENPSDALLSHWGKKRGNTLIKLMQILKNMGNDNAAEILEKARVYPEEDIHDRGEPRTKRTSTEATEDRRQSAEKVSVKNLNALVMLELGVKLDVKKSDGDRDYRYLAAHFDMSTEDIDLISEKHDQTKEVLGCVGRNPTNTVSKLRQILVEMERDDCIAIIDKKYK